MLRSSTQNRREARAFCAPPFCLRMRPFAGYNQTKSPVERKSIMAEERILIVEDDETIALGLEYALKQ